MGKSLYTVPNEDRYQTALQSECDDQLLPGFDIVRLG